MPNPDSLLASGIYRLSRRFYVYMLYLAIVVVECVIVILSPYTSIASFTVPVVHIQLAHLVQQYVLPITVLPSAPFVLYSVWKTWKSLSAWRRSFLKFTLVSNIESLAFEDSDPQERLVKAMITANPDYEEILSPQLAKSGTGYKELSDLFKNTSFTHNGKTVNFDVLIGVPGLAKRQMSTDKEQDNMVNNLLRSITRIGNMANILRAISEVGVSAARIVNGTPAIADYQALAADLKLLAAHTQSKVIRAYLVSSELPKADLVAHAKDRRNWPRYDLHRIPIDLIVQERVGYEVLLTN